MAEQMRICTQCGEEKGYSEGSCFYLDRWVCSRRCRHDAGDRTVCHGMDCGCTGYAKKRRWLRLHRRNMRVMEDVITDNGLEQELEECLIDETGNTNFWLGADSEKDEDSDQEDPEAIAKQQVSELLHEAADKQAFVATVQGALQCRAMVTDLERARMRLEDMYSRVYIHSS